MRHYDIIHIGPQRNWSDDITLRLKGERGEEQVTLTKDAPLTNIPESAITEQILFLTKPKRSRPPVVKLVEIDIEARQKKTAKDLKVLLKRSDKKAARRKELSEDSKKTKKESKKSKGKDPKKDLTPAEIEALENGTELPKS